MYFHLYYFSCIVKISLNTSILILSLGKNLLDVIYFIKLLYNHLFSNCSLPSILAVHTNTFPFYIHGAGWCNHQYHAIRNDGYPIAQINYCISGKGELIVHNKKYVIQKGMSFFLPANLKHEYYATADHWSLHWITFLGDQLINLLTQFKMSDAIVLTHTPFSKIDTLWSQIFHAIKKDTQYGSYWASAYLYEYLLEYYYDFLNSCEKTSHKEEKLAPIIDYINLHYMEELSLTDLAELSDISPQYLCKQFQSTFNMRPFEYITKKTYSDC